MTTVAVMLHLASFELSPGSPFQSHMEDLSRSVASHGETLSWCCRTTPKNTKREGCIPIGRVLTA